MAQVHDTVQVTGIHCLRCVEKIGAALQDVDGLLAGGATPTGEVHLLYDDADPGVRDRALAVLAGAGFPPGPA